MAENNNQQTPQKKSFVKSTGVKVLLILIFEVVSFMILYYLLTVRMVELDNDIPKIVTDKTVLTYWGICFVLSLGTIIKMTSSFSKNLDKGTPGVIHIMSEKRYAAKQRGDFAGILAFLFVISLLLSPFIAPVTLGSGVHAILCKFAK